MSGGQRHSGDAWRDDAMRDGVAELRALIRQHGGEASLRVTEILHALGRYTLRDVHEVAAALNEASILADPPFNGDLKRHYTVRLALAGSVRVTDASAISKRWLMPDGDVQEADGLLPDGAVLWVDVRAERPEDIPAIVRETLEIAGERLEPLETERLEQHLASRDYRPATHVYDANRSVRSVSCFVASTDEHVDTEPTDASQPKTGRLTFWPLEMGVGSRFLITVRRRGERVAAAAHRSLATIPDQVDQCDILDARALEAQLLRRWRRATSRLQDDRPMRAGDAALLLMHWSADSFLDSVRTMEAWLRQWELQVFDSQGEPERGSLFVLREMLVETEARGAAFAYPRAGDPVTGWLPGIADADEAHHVHAVLARTVRVLGSLHERVRDRLDAINDLDQDRARQRVERIGFLLLFPTLIAGVFGANTAVPGGGTWPGFIGMLATMVILTGLAYYALAGSRRRPRGPKAPRRPDTRRASASRFSELTAYRRMATSIRSTTSKREPAQGGAKSR